MHIGFVRMDKDELKPKRDAWRAEVSRRRAHNDAVIIPKVFIRAFGGSLEFEEVMVEAFDARGDVLQPGTITALDVIRSLGSQGELDYEILWYDSIAGFEIKSYFIERIDEWDASGKCGFVYEVGELSAQNGNHIHLHSDLRILHNPQYVELFWIELGAC
jgi:hypothetical protein